MGEGKYRYSAPGIPPQEIPFREIGVDSVGRTVAKGLVDKDSDFWLSPYFRFQGNVSLSAGQPHLGFEGGFRILEDCYQPGTDEWTYFKGPVDPLDVSIRLESPLRSVEGKEQELALFISDFDEEIFSSVFDRRKSAGDTLMVEAGGNISYDSRTRSYRVFEGSQYEPGRTANYFFINQHGDQRT